jgi:hypothetical protein
VHGSPRALQRLHSSFELFIWHLICTKVNTELQELIRSTFCLRHATHAVIFLVISGSFLSPNDSRKDNTADDSAIAQMSVKIVWMVLMLISCFSYVMVADESANYPTHHVQRRVGTNTEIPGFSNFSVDPQTLSSGGNRAWRARLGIDPCTFKGRGLPQ